MPEIRLDIGSRNEAERELKTTEATIRSLTRSIADLNAMASRGYGTSGATAQLTGELEAAEAKIQSLRATIASLTTPVEMLSQRVRTGFGAARSEIDSTLSSISRWTEGQRASAVAGDANFAAISKYIEAQNKARGVATYVAGEELAHRQRLRDIAAGTVALGEAQEKQRQIELTSAREALNNNLSRDAALMEAQRRQRVMQLQAAQSTEQAALVGFRSIVNSLREQEGQATRTGHAIRGMAGETDTATYTGRKLITVFDELSRNQRGQIMSTFGSMMRDAGLSGGMVFGGLGAVIALATGARIVEMMSRWGEELGSLAAHQQNVAAATGMSTDAFVTFSTAVQLAGGNAETAGRALEAMQRRMEEAVLNPSGTTMQAFRDVGLEWETLRERLADPAGARNTLLDLADAFSKMGATAERTARFTQLAGGTRQLAELVAVLRLGRAGFEELEAKANDLNPALHRNHDELVKMEERMKELGAAWEGFKASVVGGSGIFATMTTALTEALKAFQNYSFKDTVLGTALTGAGLIQKSLPGAGVVASAAIPPALPGGERFADPLNKLATVSEDLASAFRQATTALPPGWSARVTQGMEATGHAPDSEHHGPFGAIDYTLYDEAGKRVGHEAAKVIGSQAEQVYHSFEYKFKSLTPGAGRAGVDFGDPGHVDEGLLTGKAPGRFARPVDFDAQAAERLYLARLKSAEVAATELHQDEQRAAILQKEADFMALGPTERAKFLEQNINLGKAEAAAQTQLLGVYDKQWSLAQQLNVEHQQAALASIKQEEAEARASGNVSKIVELRQRELQIIASSAYATPAQKIEAETQLLQAQLDVRRQNYQLEQERASAMGRSNADVLRGFEAEMATAVDRRQIKPQQAFGFDIQEVYKLAGEQEKILANLMKMADATGDATKQTKIYWQEWELGVQTQEKVLELQKRLADEVKRENDAMVQPLKQAFSGIGGALETFLEGAITKTKTLKESLQTLATSVIKDIAHGLLGIGEKLFVKAIGGTAGQGIADFLAQKAGSLLGFGTSAATSTASAATMTTAITAGGTAAAAEMGTSITAAGSAAAAAMGAAISAAGTGSAAAGAAGKAVTGLLGLGFLGLSGGGMIPSAAGGMKVNDGIGGQLIIAHPGERVLSAAQTEAFHSLIRGIPSAASGIMLGDVSFDPSNIKVPGDFGARSLQMNVGRSEPVSTSTTLNYSSNVTGYHPYGTRQSFEAMLRQHSSTLQTWVDSALRGGAFRSTI